MSIDLLWKMRKNFIPLLIFLITLGFKLLVFLTYILSSIIIILNLFKVDCILTTNPFYIYSFLNFLINLFFNWRIIALQNFVVFCHISTRISHRYTRVPSLPNLSHLPLHPTPLGWYTAPVWVSWAIQQISIGYLFYIW